MKGMSKLSKLPLSVEVVNIISCVTKISILFHNKHVKQMLQMSWDAPMQVRNIERDIRL